VVGTVAVLVLAGCGPARGVDKAGNQTVVLEFSSIDGINDNGQSYGPQAFIDALEQVSGGKIKVRVRTDDDGNPDPAAETGLVKAIASGDLDGGWPTVRAFARAGIPGLQPVEAPMTITSYAAEKDLVTGPVAAKLLATLDGTGVVGLGLAVGPLRRPFAASKPLLGLPDWSGARFRTLNSPVQEDTIRALGAVPVTASFGWVDMVHAGTLRGADFDLAQYSSNGLTTEAGNVTSNVVLWPKTFVLSLSRKRFDALTPHQRDWVREAAARAVRASADAGYDENVLAQTLCAKGVQFYQAGAQQVAAMRTAVSPVIARLAADPIEGPLLRAVQEVAASHPQPDVPVPTGTCTAQSGGLGEIPTGTSNLPDGTYRVALSAGDVTAAGLVDANGISGTWTLTVRQGGYEITCRPLQLPGADCGREVTDAVLEAGDLRGAGQAVYFVGVPERMSRLTGCQLPASPDAGHCRPPEPYRATWELHGTLLTFTDVWFPCECDTLSLKPWQKIA
jgi:TRAP-type C4-dicarboxylate transport system substrate-binding protein